MPAPTAEPDRYNPAAIFRNFDPQRPWHILVVDAGAQLRVAERAKPAGIDVYFPTGMFFSQRAIRGSAAGLTQQTEVEGPVWGRYVAASVQSDRTSIEIGHALAVRGVVEILCGEDGRPYNLPALEVRSWWERQQIGALDDGVRHKRRLFPKWCRPGRTVRIIGGMTTMFSKALQGVVWAMEGPDDIKIDVELMGRKTRVSAPLVFLEKVG